MSEYISFHIKEAIKAQFGDIPELLSTPRNSLMQYRISQYDPKEGYFSLAGGYSESAPI